MAGCCSQVGVKAVAKAGLVAATRWGWLLLPSNTRLLFSATRWGWLLLPQIPGCCYEVGLRAVAKSVLVAATRWRWLLLRANARLLLSGGAEGSGQCGAGSSE
uniref:Uncharacterized protein n=1 Tax=Timema poppense TaxID=170557 RepID=A0A7R9DYG3_TIMPO|nr:unnamed protein product [Timema poppensis]